MISPRTLGGGERRYDVRLRDANGRTYTRTFRTKKEAETFEAQEKADRSRGTWIDPRRTTVTLRQYADQWMSRPDLRPRTRELYEGLLRLHIYPTLDKVELGKLSPSTVRQWRSSLLTGGLGESTVAKSYRLLRTILNTAVADEVIHRNPCVIRGAGVERAAERPVATVAEVYALADAVPQRYRALVLLAAFVGPRRGEAFALRRCDIDVLHGTMRVERQHQQLKDGSLHVGEPKTDAGIRTVALPQPMVEELERHMAEWTPADRDALLFPGAKGGPLRPHVWQKYWAAARTRVGVEHLHFHDLRHTGNTLTAATGASTRELMHRLGHSSPDAALRYQHATKDRDLEVARLLSELILPKPADVVPIDRARDGRAMGGGGD